MAKHTILPIALAAIALSTPAWAQDWDTFQTQPFLTPNYLDSLPQREFYSGPNGTAEVMTMPNGNGFSSFLGDNGRSLTCTRFNGFTLCF